ncbi:unannotated protein [freshwater metagenome]|uniref:Unannotated protein n=1 Tax=freshwater metagenome TaxID=449393 RepID=A0A6J6G043_9ZZZZ
MFAAKIWETPETSAENVTLVPSAEKQTDFAFVVLGIVVAPEPSAFMSTMPVDPIAPIFVPSGDH